MVSYIQIENYKGILREGLHQKNILIIPSSFLILLVFHFDISGKDDKDLQLWHI